MKEVTTSVIENKALLLGENYFETGSFNLAVGQELKEGAFLKRGAAAGTFELVEDIEEDDPVAICPTTIKNTKETAQTVSLGACIGGRVRADMLHINGEPVNAAEIDLIRKYGFIPIYANDISRTDS